MRFSLALSNIVENLNIVGNLRVPRFFVWTLLLAFAAAAADQFVVPALFSTAPLCALLACLVLVTRSQGDALTSLPSPSAPYLVTWRVLGFFAAHAALIGTVYRLDASVSRASGALNGAGWTFLLVKLAVLAPMLLLLPWRTWQYLAHTYAAEFAAAAVVLVTFFPRRVMEALWPVYGQFVGRCVYLLAWPMVSNLGYVKALYPTLTGPNLDVTILLSCSGINGIELFDALFALVVFCEWPRLNKRRTLAAYFIGVVAMTLGNILRITSFVVLGNHGFADFIARFHVNAGWLFFSLVFLLFLSSTYRWMLTPSPANRPA
jgi:exosortase/archaeosortase family protein